MTNDSEEPRPAPTIANTASDLADLLRLHFEASRVELGQFMDEWARNMMKNTLAAAVSVVLGGIGGIFLLIAAALAIGDALDHVSWGLLIVGGALAAVAGGFAVTRFVLERGEGPGAPGPSA